MGFRALKIRNQLFLVPLVDQGYTDKPGADDAIDYRD